MKTKEYGINDVVFPVGLNEVFVNTSQYDLFGKATSSELVKANRYNAVVCKDSGYVFSIVGNDYKLVTNEKAIELGEECFRQVFKLTDISSMELFNIIMPQTRSFCHIDFIHKDARFSPFDNDPWTPYLRITNSYNRTYALNFDLGFCRGICKNGVIFGKKNIKFKFTHSKRAKDPKVEFLLRAGDLAHLEKEFTESLYNLKRFHVPSNVVWPLCCKVFRIAIPDGNNKRQNDIWQQKQNEILIMTNKYFKEIGENAYAALNVLTDFATRPVGMISAEQRIDSLQRSTGNWMGDFIKEIESRDFTFKHYLGEYAELVA